MLVFLLVLATCVQASMLGGASNAQVDDHAREVAGFAVQQLSARNAFGATGHELVEVVGYKTQVVAGINHILTLRIKTSAGDKTVEVKVWEKPAYNQPTNEPAMELTNFNETEGAAEAGADDYAAAAEQALAQINSRSNSLFPYELSALQAAVPANDGSGTVTLNMSATQNGKPAAFEATVQRQPDGRYRLLNFQQQQPGAVAQ